MSIEQRLKILLEAYDESRGDRELAIFYYDQQWNLEIGNPSNVASLGEVCGDYCYTSSMLEECVEMAEKELLTHENQ
jgi:hypothetical protein